jgi:hypothetical protein
MAVREIAPRFRAIHVLIAASAVVSARVGTLARHYATAYGNKNTPDVMFTVKCSGQTSYTIQVC